MKIKSYKHIVLTLALLALALPALAADTLPPERQHKRDPFSEMAEAAIKPDYDKAVNACLLRGIIKAGGRELVLMEVGGEAENSSPVLHTLEPGGILNVVVARREYSFRVGRIKERSVELHTDQHKTYIVGL